jgi:hypothetical protein
MEDRNLLKNTQIIILGICIALGTVISSWLIARAMVKMKKISTEVIDVTGSAERNILSDDAVWTSEFSRRDSSMTAAFQLLQDDLVKVKRYLVLKGIKEDEIWVNAVGTNIFYMKNEKGNDTNQIEGYRLTQSVTVHSVEVGKVSQASRSATELIQQGIEFVSNAPQFFYTKLSDLKMEILQEATQNAKQRAEQMAKSTGNKIGVMRSAKSGVFQITPANSVEVSDWGVNDTSSLEKKVTGVVHLDFAIEE